MMQRNNLTGKPVRLARSRRISGALQAVRDSCAADLSLPCAKNAPWIVLRTETGREKAVENILREAGAMVLVPMRKGPERRRHHKVIPPQDIPLMTGYVLLRVVYSSRIGQALAGVQYVIGVLGAVGKPHMVSHASVCELMEKASGGAFDWERPVPVVYADGDKVVIKDGVFSGFKGCVVGRSSSGRGDIVVELDMFGRLQPVLLPLASVRKM